MPYQQPLPRQYDEMTSDDLAERIVEHKKRLGGALCILGHHYQRDEVIRFADLTGDSLKLSQLAASQTEARHIVFCGVHFMAESADILSGDDQIVILPNMRAGCPMADMADAEGVAAAIGEIARMSDGAVIPISYVNSPAAVKALTGRAGGACCTSSNVRNVFDWALAPRARGGGGARRILAVPDRHLAENTALAMGCGPHETALYDPALPDGGLTKDDVEAATFILWNGHCYVHQLFTADHVRAVRAEHPDITVIVHPECPREVVALADASGSTEQIIRAVAAGASGSKWAVGTESNLVNRLAQRHEDRFVRTLSDAPANCGQMARIDQRHLLWVLDNLADRRPVNQVAVASDVAADALSALQRMIDIKAATDTTPGPGNTQHPGTGGG